MRYHVIPASFVTFSLFLALKNSINQNFKLATVNIF